MRSAPGDGAVIGVIVQSPPPDSLRDTPTAEALEALADLELTALADIEPPRGYGRD
jgi:hypothetical protein